jgi:glutamate N-acetyltransferase/amino-acid N-acetyltransferase
MTAYRCNGFLAAGIHSGLKADGELDLGLIFSETPATVAGVFTQNQIKAAPVLIDQQRIQSGVARAIIANSGNANCCNGEQGYQHALDMTITTAQQLKTAEADVLVSSTGVIGEPLPIHKINAAAPDLYHALHSEGFDAFARAIMTTDTVPKIKHRQGIINGQIYNVLGVCKGSGMIAPNMATMLCFVCTDLAISQPMLQPALESAVDATLNRICIDGDTSTNDTTLILANGCSDASITTQEQADEFQMLLQELLAGLAKKLVKDGEGVSKCVEIRVVRAGSDADAHKIANTVATSPLVKTALFGMDANWGRIIAATGRAGVPIDPGGIDIYFDDVQMTQKSLGCGPEAEKKVTRVLQKPEFTITIDLNLANGDASVLTCDFSIDYVKINADYRS